MIPTPVKTLHVREKKIRDVRKELVFEGTVCKVRTVIIKPVKKLNPCPRSDLWQRLFSFHAKDKGKTAFEMKTALKGNERQTRPKKRSAVDKNAWSG